MTEGKKPTQELRKFELPSSIWQVMFASYAVFFAAIAFATARDGSAVFVIVVSVGYTIIYFGTTAILASLRNQHVPIQRSVKIDTHTGELDYNAVFAQILTVPISIAFMACAIAVIRELVS